MGICTTNGTEVVITGNCGTVAVDHVEDTLVRVQHADGSNPVRYCLFSNLWVAEDGEEGEVQFALMHAPTVPLSEAARTAATWEARTKP